ncbi:MAG: histidinol phosphate phosphatase domain-containing protein [Candidatus Altiarchaeota archaeon]
MDSSKRYECHAHTFYSDGELSPMELVRRAFVMDHALIALTDHVDFSNIEHVLSCQKKILPEISWDIKVLVGVELTHIPKDKIPKLVSQAKKLGAQVVIVHGESPVEPVEEGTNDVAVNLPDVDIIAHPGNITVEQAERAGENGIFLELTSRRGHKQGNRRVAEAALAAGAKMLVNTDAHSPEDLITQKQAFDIAVESGLSEKQALQTISENPKILL